jgi:hypothetical protein
MSHPTEEIRRHQRRVLWSVLLLLALIVGGCSGGTFIRLPAFPDSSCSTCGPSYDERPN